ncbi:MAG: metallopeptidase family protein [Planctomycetota bacterium]|jgi:predicted Zn-dependent protease with MMP-like domain
MNRLFDRLDDLALADEFDAVEAEALRALESDPDAEDIADLWRYVSWARFETGRMQSALDAALTAGDALYEAKAFFHLWRFDEARSSLDDFVGGGADAAEVAFYRAMIEEFTGGDPQPHYAAAARIAPDLFPPPVRLTDAEVDAVMRDALGELPAGIRKAIENTVVAVRPLPAPHPDVDPLSLGLYVGRSLIERSVLALPELPAQIEIYRANIERIARDRQHAIEELRITLLHEVGHHLGFDEDGVADLGLE